MKWPITVLTIGLIAAGCTPNKKSDASMSASAVQPAVLEVPAAPPATYTPAAAPPPAAPQPVVYDSPQEAAPQSADAVEADNNPDTQARPAAASYAPAHHYASVRGTHYKVKKGDSLWAIASAHYGNGNKWKTIAAANPRVNPNHLLVGQTLTLP